MKGLGALLKHGYKWVVRSDKEFQEKKLRLLGILLQATKGVAELVVRPFADKGDWVEAWKALISRYGTDSKELQSAHQIEYQRMPESTKCEDREGILDMVHTAERPSLLGIGETEL